MSTQTCHEGVTKADEFQPCDKPAVAMRYDEEAGSPYPVCVKHVRKPMVPLDQHDAEVAGKALRDAAAATRTHTTIGQKGQRTTSERPELSAGPRAFLIARSEEIEGRYKSTAGDERDAR